MLTATSRPASSGRVDLERLIERQTPLSWFEAVAIVQELCDVLLESRRGGPAAQLEPGDVAITAEGGVDVRGGVVPGLPTVAQVAHLLLTLLGQAQTLPVQLRLLALQEVSPTPSCPALRELSARLAPFERPNRRDTIRAVHERFVQLPARDDEAAAKEQAPVRRSRATRPAWWRNRKVQSAAASVALLVAAGIAAAWLWPVVAPLLSGLGSRGQGDVSAARAEESEALSAAAVERIFATARRIWLGAGARLAAPTQNATLDAKPIHVGGAAGLPAGPSPKPAVELPLPEASTGSRTAAAEATVFSAADAEVVPPSLLRPHLPTSPRGSVRAEDLPQVELLVSPTGEVESVRLVTQRAGVASAMMLSAIKTWRFEPANRRGQPVRYRVLVRLTNQ
jgi:hypothetical protein